MGQTGNATSRPGSAGEDRITTSPCSRQETPLTAKQICEGQGGVYVSAEQYCGIEARK